MCGDLSKNSRFPQDQISRVNAMLTQEYGTASNIKSRVNRLSVLAAITSTQQRLKLYNRVPPNGLVLFVGTILTDEGKEKQVTFDFEPHKPVNTLVKASISTGLCYNTI
jgi:peptide chain release factor subunit 1